MATKCLDTPLDIRPSPILLVSLLKRHNPLHRRHSPLMVLSMLLDLLRLADRVLQITVCADDRLGKDVGVLQRSLDFGRLKEVVEFAVHVRVNVLDRCDRVEGLDEGCWGAADWVSERGFALSDELGLTAHIGGLSLAGLGEGVWVFVTALCR